MAEIKSVKWKNGFHGKIKAKSAYDALEKIKSKNNGVLTAGIVVIEASKSRNPLHKQFEWDDSIAAEKYRMEEARNLLRAVHVVYSEAPNVQPQRHYVAVTEQESQDTPERKVYKSTAEILSDPVARDEVLGNAIRDAISFRRKYAALQELSKVFVAVDDFIEHNKAV